MNAAFTWKDKMNLLVKAVLGDDYYVWVEDEHKYKVFLDGKQLYSTETILDISAHWKEETKRIIRLIVDNKIIDAINTRDIFTI